MIVFMDSSALKADYDSKDDNHVAARRLMRQIAARETQVTSFMTTDYVLDEAITLTLFAHSHAKAIELAEATMASKFVRLIYSDAELFAEAMLVFRGHADKDWSFTDCLSFAAMKRYDVKTAFTFDSHFKQMGFDTIP
ncbi:MAG: type II toxin-antitoxin system VapC family toxin [Thaumarchaeota archaeon]|nr:type II toxin-antitoxin system VapC family toxin [Nitrososphaerota archaeon]